MPISKPALSAARRLFLTQLLSFGLFAAAAKAEGDYGYELPSSYSQEQFARLDRHTINTIYNAYAWKRPVPRLIGFSKNMATLIFGMAFDDRRATQRLIRDMAKLTDKAKRVARLKQEQKDTEKLIANIEASLERLRKKKGSLPVLEARAHESGRLARTRRYLKRVKIWVKSPMDGTLTK